MFRERINCEKEENEKYISKKYFLKSSKLQKGSKEGSVSDKASTISNPSSSSEKCINFLKEKKIQSLNEMAMRLTKTLAEEEEALDEKLKLLKKKSSNSNEKENIKESKILSKATDSDNLSVEEVIEKLKNILPDPKAKPASKTIHIPTNTNNIFTNEIKNDLISRFYKSDQDYKGISQLGLNSDPVKFNRLNGSDVPHFLNSFQSHFNFPEKHTSNLLRVVKPQYSPEQVKAATIIQAYYRGYQVRKITSSLLKKSYSKGYVQKRSKVYPHKDIRLSQNIKSYNNNSTALPIHLKPFYNLVEYGDINTFTDSCLKTKTQNYVKETQKFNKHSEDKYSKVPVSIPSLEKCYLKNDNINSAFDNREISQSIKRDSNISDEVDLKNFCTNKIFTRNVYREDKSNILSLRSGNNFTKKEDRKDDDYTNISSYDYISNDKIHAASYKTISAVVSSSSSNATDVSSSIYSMSHHHKPLENKDQNSIQVKTTNTLGISPSHLRSKINAELVFQDTIGSALNHLQDLQNIKALSKTQDLTVSHPKLQDKCLNTENHGYIDESQSSLYKKKFQDDIKKLEREAQERMAKMEQDLKEKVEKMFNSASKVKTSKPDSRTSNFLLVNKYSFDNTEGDSSSISQESVKSSKKHKKLLKYNNKSDSSDKTEYSLHSVNSLSDAVSVTEAEDYSSKENAFKSQYHIDHSSDKQADMSDKQANLNESIDMCDLKIYKNKAFGKLKYSQSVVTGSGNKQSHSKGVLESQVSTTEVQKKVPDSLSIISKVSDAQILPEIDFIQPGSSSMNIQNENSVAQNIRSYDNKDTDSKTSTDCKIEKDTDSKTSTDCKIEKDTDSKISTDYKIEKDTDNRTLLQKESFHNTQRNAMISESETFSKMNEDKNNALFFCESNFKNSKIRDESYNAYSEPFDSEGNNVDLTLDPVEKSLLSSTEEKGNSIHSTQKQKEKLGDDINEETFKNVRGGALQSMLNLLLSLQKEEEIRFKHQLAVFKLQEQFLIEEARLKLISANSEGGVNLRKRQRAIFLQLREQRSHIKRLIETQKLAAQQRQMFFNQHYNLLLSTSNSGSRVTPPRIHSPLSNNIEFSSSDGCENSSSTSFSKGLRKIGQTYSLLKEDSSYKNKNDIVASSGAKDEYISKPNIHLKKDISKRRDEISKNDNLRHLNQDKVYILKTDESDTSELEASRSFLPKRNSYQNVNISYKEQNIKENLLKDISSNVSNTHESRNQIQVVSETQYLSNHRTAKSNIEIDLVHSQIKSTENIKSNKENIVSGKIFNTKSNIPDEKLKRQSGSLPFALRYPLSPRSSIHYRRQSSESDDSFNLSQNDTISDISDHEGKLAALREELVLRKTEAERLKKERRRIIKERISTQEQALRNQIAVYDNFIEQKKQEIDIESQKLLKVTSVKPLIKKPQASSTKTLHNESPNINESICNENVIDESLISDNTSTYISNESNLCDSLSGQNEGNVEVKSNRINKAEELHDSIKAGEKVNENLSTFSHSTVENLSSSVQDQKHIIKEIEGATSKPKVDPVLKNQQKEQMQQHLQQHQLQQQQLQELELQLQQQLQQKKEFQEKQLQQQQDQQKQQQLQKQQQDQQKQQQLQQQQDQQKQQQLQQQQDQQKQQQDQQKQQQLQQQQQQDQQKQQQLQQQQQQDQRKLQLLQQNQQKLQQQQDQQKQQQLQQQQDQQKLQRLQQQQDQQKQQQLQQQQQDQQKQLQQDQQNQQQQVPVYQQKQQQLHTYQQKQQQLQTDQQKQQQFQTDQQKQQQLQTNQQQQLQKDQQQQQLQDHLQKQLQKEQQQLHEKQDQLDKKQQQQQIQIENEQQQQQQFQEEQREQLLQKDEQQQQQIIKLDKKPDVLPVEGIENIILDLGETRLLSKANYENESPVESLKEEKIFVPKEENDNEKPVDTHHSEAELVEIVTADDNKEIKDAVSLVKDNVDLRKKANDLADYILNSLVSDSIMCMRRLLRNKNKSQVIIFDIISQSDDPLVGCEALGKDFEAFVKTKTTVQNDISSLEADFIPSAIEYLPCKESILEKSDNGEMEERIEKATSWFDEQNRVFSNYNGPSEFYKGTDINETFSVSSCEGAWLEGDFWKSEDHMKTKELREAEELINAEIARLEELERFKEKYPNLVIREVPDKPPPPYTPPKDVATLTVPSEKLKLPEPQTPSNTISVPHRLSKADLRRIASDIVNVVPSKDELISAVKSNCIHIYSEWQKGMNPASVQYPALISISTLDVEEIDPSESSEAAFNYLIFNLTRQYVCEVFDYVNAPPPPVWATPFHNPKKTNWKISKNTSEESVVGHVMKNVRIDLGIDPASKRESAMMKWALKRREPVDQIIVQEFQTEELSWVQYYEEEAFVKTQISKEILSSLIDDTVCVFNNILTKLL